MRIAADLAHVEAAVVELHRLLDSCRACDSCFEFELLCFEALSNAVRHGCGCDPTLGVTAEVRTDGDRVTLRVTDDGPGFDWKTQRRQIPAPDASHGRGLWIIAKYSDQVCFNCAGNEVTITRRVRQTCQPMELQGAPAA